MILTGRARWAGDRASRRVKAQRGQAKVRSRRESVRPRGRLQTGWLGGGTEKVGVGAGAASCLGLAGLGGGLARAREGAAERGLCGARGRPGTRQGPRGSDPQRGTLTTPIPPMSLLKKRMLLSENLVKNVFFPNFCFLTCRKSHAGPLRALPC